MQTWNEAQKWESEWWGDCTNTVEEELKQRVYFKYLKQSLDLEGRSVLDLGGGPVSYLLKCRNRGKCVVVDPLKVPNWVEARYKENGITFFNIQAEKYRPSFIFDEVWIYNVLQHVEDPEKVIGVALDAGKIVKVFEWLETPKTPGHLHTLSDGQMDRWLGGEGKVRELNEGGCHGKSYVGIFKGKHYEKV